MSPVTSTASSGPRPSLGAALYTAKQRSIAAFLGPAAGLWHSFMGSRAGKGDRKVLAAIDRLHGEALRQDYAAADEGLYPHRLLVPPPGWHDRRFLAEAILDAPSIYRRKRQGAFDVPVTPGQDLPGYYLRTFHWQTDGWLSAHSARVYEVQVEFLFFGTMDVMRRRALAALVRALGGDRRRMRVRVLDVACGTGRFLEQARAALPEATLEGVDLSPHYVERARRRLRGRAAFRVGNAEALGGEDEAYDAVTCGFLFHELPADARERVLREAYRVLEPGGVLVVQDSMQRVDPNGHELEVFLDWFPVAYHEPYYKGYSHDDLAARVEQAGFRVTARDHVLFSKVVVATKPHPAPA
jgi:ubiquinone/menaquinone biosynthesis C-methylase UbiE